MVIKSTRLETARGPAHKYALTPLITLFITPHDLAYHPSHLLGVGVYEWGSDEFEVV